MPAYDDQFFNPPAPLARVTLRNPGDGRTVSDVPARNRVRSCNNIVFYYLSLMTRPLRLELPGAVYHLPRQRLPGDLPR